MTNAAEQHALADDLRMEFPNVDILSSAPKRKQGLLTYEVKGFQLLDENSVGSDWMLVSSPVTVNEVTYVFEVNFRQRAYTPSQRYIYFSVVGPSNEAGYARGHFQLTEDYRWTGTRALHPVAVKQALRRWMSSPEVSAAISKAKASKVGWFRG
jgi:hypothetical protein